MVPFDNYLEELRREEDGDRIRYLMHPDNIARLLQTGFGDLHRVLEIFFGGMFEEAGGGSVVQQEELQPQMFAGGVAESLADFFSDVPGHAELYSRAYERFYAHLDRHSADSLGAMVSAGVNGFLGAGDATLGLFFGCIGAVKEAFSAKNALDGTYVVMMHGFNDFLACVRNDYLALEEKAVLFAIAYKNALAESTGNALADAAPAVHPDRRQEASARPKPRKAAPPAKKRK